MPSRQDQLHSYQFMVQRVVSALVVRETDPAQSPFRRVATAALASLVVAMVMVAGFAVYGVFAGGANTNWKSTANAVIVEEETGASFVYLDGVLHPVRNHASALLIAAGGTPTVLSVSRASLAGTPRGPMLGIADAPDALPGPGQLLSGSWRVCTTSVKDPKGGDTAEASLLAVGGAAWLPSGGSAFDEDSATLVTAEGADVHLLWRDRRYLIPDADQVGLKALNMSAQPVRRVDAAFLNAIPAGDPLTPLELEGKRSEFRQVAVGKTYKVANPSGDSLYYVAVVEGLAQITALQANLLSYSRRQDLHELEFAELPRRTGSLIPQGEGAMPRTPPKFLDVGSGAICATVIDDQGVSGIHHDVTVPMLRGLARTAGERGSTRAVIADYVLVEPGHGVLVEGYPTPGASSGVVSLVTDLGQQFAIENDAAKAALGFGAVTPVRMPTVLVSLLPQGPRLDPDDARQTVTLS